MSAIARVLLEKGIEVSGSDRHASLVTTDLKQSGARVFIGHDPRYINGADLIVRSSAVNNANVEVQAALEMNLPVYKREEFLKELITDEQTIAVAGSHGKTTTTSMLAWVLTSMGLDPSYIIGGVSVDLNSNAHAGSGKSFVIEADEYDYMFLGLNPDIAVVMNIEYDHPDCFPSEKEFFQARSNFIRKLYPRVNGLFYSELEE